MSYFVPLGRDFWEAWKGGEDRGHEFGDELLQLCLFVAFEADFRTGELVTTLESISSMLDWDVDRSTTSRRLEKLVQLGFITSEIRGVGRRRRHVLSPTERLYVPKSTQQAATKNATHELPTRAGWSESHATGDARHKKRQDKTRHEQSNPVRAEQQEEGQPTPFLHPLADEVERTQIAGLAREQLERLRSEAGADEIPGAEA